eukprot:symbB.v1.2.010915.t1/scaffold697.1/size171729/6
METTNAENRSLGCDTLTSTPKIESLALLVERGLCPFRDKVGWISSPGGGAAGSWGHWQVRNAYEAGYKALIVSNTLPGASKVPDMTSPGGEVEDRLVELPAWAVDLATGQAIRSWMTTDAQLIMEVVDHPRRPALGPFQADSYGQRLVLPK